MKHLIEYLRDFTDDAPCHEAADRLEKLEALRDSVQDFVDAADDEDLLIGCGRNSPNEKEGPLGREIRRNLAALPVEVNFYKEGS